MPLPPLWLALPRRPAEAVAALARAESAFVVGLPPCALFAAPCAVFGPAFIAASAGCAPVVTSPVFCEASTDLLVAAAAFLAASRGFLIIGGICAAEGNAVVHASTSALIRRR